MNIIHQMYKDTPGVYYTAEHKVEWSRCLQRLANFRSLPPPPTDSTRPRIFQIRIKYIIRITTNISYITSTSHRLHQTWSFFLNRNDISQQNISYNDNIHYIYYIGCLIKIRMQTNR